MSEKDQGDLLSFFQIGAIHGLPHTPWNGSGVKNANSYGGYCAHGNVLFPTWHRPYLALYEVGLVPLELLLPLTIFYSNYSNSMPSK